MARMARTGTAALVFLAVLATTGSAEAKISPAKAASLQKDLGEDRTAGIYVDHDSGNMVVTVTDEKAADRVRDAGGIAKLVKRSEHQLEKVTALLAKKAKIAGTSWGINPKTNKVDVTYDTTVNLEERTKLKDVIDEAGEAAVDTEKTGLLRPFIAGGDAILGASSRCSLGFNVLRGGVRHFLTAGHCGKTIATWSTPSASTIGFSFPSDDYALVTYTGSTATAPVTATGNVDLYNGTFQEISSAANAVVGQTAKKSGSTTHVSTGSVQGLNQTVNYPQGTVSGLIRTSVCAQPGDSGGALFAGTVALGLVSGGSGSCSTGGTVYYQPIGEVLSKYGATIY